MVFLQFNGTHGKPHGLDQVQLQRLGLGEGYRREEEIELLLQLKQLLQNKQEQVLGIE